MSRQCSVQSRCAKIGRMHGGQIEVLDGLGADAKVVIDGASFLENGETVRLAAQ